MTDRDLTPEEARAEIEAFMGTEWTVIAPERDGTEDAGEECYVSAWRGVVGLHAFCPTYRAAVSALKQAWRDAVRPWVAEAVHESGTHAARIAKTYDEAPERRAWDTAEAAILTDLHDPDDPDTLRVIARVLKEDSRNG